MGNAEEGIGRQLSHGGIHSGTILKAPDAPNEEVHNIPWEIESGIGPAQDFATIEAQWRGKLNNEELLVHHMDKDPSYVNVDMGENDFEVMEKKSYLEQQASTPLYDGAPVSRLSTIILLLYLQVPINPRTTSSFPLHSPYASLSLSFCLSFFCLFFNFFSFFIYFFLTQVGLILLQNKTHASMNLK